MLYHFLEYLDSLYDFPGSGLYQYLSFRAALAAIFSLLFSMIFGKSIINYLRRQQIGESIRDLGLEGQNQKAGTPTMGGIIIILSTLVPVLLLTNLGNIYIIMLLITTVWMGCIGFVDDYIKVFRKNKDGLKGKFKVFGQVGLGIIIGLIMYFHDDVTTRSNIVINQTTNEIIDAGEKEKSTKTNIPFFKNNELEYSKALTWISKDLEPYAWIIFIPIVIFIVTAISNGANLTDGIDGLAAGSSAIIVLTLGIFAWISGNVIFSNYLNIMNIPESGEMVIFIAAFTGALIGFLWYNTYPAQVFMGDTGSLTIGGIIAVIAIAVRKELLLFILCGIFVIENFSVVLQVGWFKYTRKKFGEGRRIFLMAPLHHHYQKKGFHESKIVVRFWIVGILLAVISIITLKVR